MLLSLAALTGLTWQAAAQTAVSYTFSVSPDTPGSPAQSTGVLDAGTNLPLALTYHGAPGADMAHASFASVPSPISPAPANGEVVGTIGAEGDFISPTPCGTPDSVTLITLWDDPAQGTPVAGQVAELKIPTSLLTLMAQLTLTTGGDAQQSAAHYDFSATIPIGLLACAGSTLKTTNVLFDYSRPITDLGCGWSKPDDPAPACPTGTPTTPPIIGSPSDRVVQKNPATAGAHKNCISYLSTIGGSFAGCGSYTLASPTPSPSPSPSPTPTPSPSPSPSPIPTPSPSPSPTPSPSPSPTPTPSPTPSPSPSPTPSPTPTASPTPSPTPKPSVSPSPTPTVTPAPSCDPSADVPGAKGRCHATNGILARIASGVGRALHGLMRAISRIGRLF